MNKLATAAAALATAGLLVATPQANAAAGSYAQTIADPVGDVVAEDTEVVNVPVSRAVGIAGGADASSVRVSHTSGFVTVQFSAPNITNGTRLDVDLRAAGRTYSFSWRFAEYRELFREGSGIVNCATTVTRTFGATDRATVKIPRNCLGAPATVSARAMVSVGRTYNLDCNDRELDYEGTCKDPVGAGRDPSGTDIDDARWTSFLSVKQ